MKRMLIFLFICAVSLSANEEKPFVIGRLKGQLGNQFFEVAAAMSHALDHGAEVYFPDLAENGGFNISHNYRRIFSKLNADRPDREVQFYYREPRHAYDPIPFIPDMEMDGFFQSELYFKHNFEMIRPYFEAPQDIIDDLMRDHKDIVEYPKTVSIHVRTYFGEGSAPNFFGLCGLPYLERAMALFPDEDTLFVVFSDKIWWCKMALRQTNRNIIYIENQDYLHDFYLMSLCKHNIISNSTFSWWAAYLNKNPGKIVAAPAKWFAHKPKDSVDLLPEDWIKIEW